MNSDTFLGRLEFAPKYVKIRETIRRQVRDGKLKPCEKLPSDSELMERHQVSRITVVNAVRDLVREGLLTRKAPQGTFVVANPNGQRRPGIVAFVLHASGHVFSEMARPLIGAAQSAGLYPLIFDPDQVNSVEDRGRLRALLDEELRFIVVQGYAGFPFDVICEKPACFQRVVFVETCETDIAFPGTRKVLVDYDEAGRMVIDHLFRRGHRRIMVYGHQPKPYDRISVVLNGCRLACDRHGVSFEQLLSMVTWESESPTPTKELYDALARRDRPTAVFCFQDSHAREVYAAARKLRLRIPDDLAVVGFFNTPWCEVLDPPLTSVSIHPERIGEMVGAIITGKVQASEEPIMIKPSLIIRGSCSVPWRANGPGGSEA